MEPKHTKGPWTAQIYHRQWQAGREYAFVTAGRDIVPVAAIPLRVEGMPADEGEANAYLTAAGPRMYAALAAAAARFRAYEREHLEKAEIPHPGLAGQMEAAARIMKADRNREMAELCEATLASARGEL
jgi:hypothetical protein